MNTGNIVKKTHGISLPYAQISAFLFTKASQLCHPKATTSQISFHCSTTFRWFIPKLGHELLSVLDVLVYD